MKIHQLSLFLENKPGHLIEPLRLLARAGVDLRTLAVADTRQFGLLRMIVSDWPRATQLLRQAGYAVTVTEVLAVEVPDAPGGLAGVLELFAGGSINIEYLYAFPFGRAGRAVIIFRFDKPDEAIERLRAAGINVVESVAVYGNGRTT
jgi:hypothetical protein